MRQGKKVNTLPQSGDRPQFLEPSKGDRASIVMGDPIFVIPNLRTLRSLVMGRGSWVKGKMRNCRLSYRSHSDDAFLTAQSLPGGAFFTRGRSGGFLSCYRD